MSGGVLLCADREENDGFSKRSVDKIYRVAREQGSIFIAGAGPTSVIGKVHAAMERALDDKIDLATRHVHILEKNLKAVIEQYAKDLGIGFVIVVAFNSPGAKPLLYKTDRAVLVQEQFYASAGAGTMIADYLAGRLDKPGMLDKITLTALAAFILREAERSTSGVGLGADMIFIQDREFHILASDAVKELQDGIPELSDAVWPYWKQNLKVPKWLEGK
jgi:20S proteasome alpha/beta subunit